jgi:drug/metabolite transporter (DMT)-like permease
VLLPGLITLFAQLTTTGWSKLFLRTVGARVLSALMIEYQDNTQSNRSLHRGMALILLATVGFGLNPLFARWAYSGGLSAETALLYRFLVPALVLLPFMAGARHDWIVAGKAVALGMFVALGTITYFRSIAAVPVATAALVYFTHPLFTILLGRLFFGTPLTKNGLTTVALVLLACALILSPSGLSVGQFQALAVSFLMPVSFATLILGFENWIWRLPLWPRTALTLWGQVVVIVPVLLLVPASQLTPSTPLGWVGVVGLASVSSLLPQVLTAAGIPLIGAARTSVLGSAELITSLLTGWLILGESVRVPEVLGAALIILAVWLSSRT